MGAINETLDARTQAAGFESGGAAAISILTEPHRFGGSIRDLKDAAKATQLPLLRKDFHICVEQLDEALAAAASAVLLIARALPPTELATLMAAAHARGLDAVVEVRTEGELDTAMEGGARIIGVNSRDLETLEVDERVPARLIPMIPPEILTIWESGVQSVEDVRRAANAGADAVLIGSALSRAPDAVALLRSLSGITRKVRHG